MRSTNSAQKIVARTDSGGYLIAEVQIVHTHECPNWRSGTRHGPCKCGAQELWEAYKKAQGTADPFSGIKLKVTT